MKLTLQITASAQTLAAILANLPADASAALADDNTVALSMGGAVDPASISPPLPVPAPVAAPAAVPVGTPPLPPLAPVTAPTNGDDDDEGEQNDAAPDVDSKGFPWDERIHAGTKATNKDGSWRYKRGIAADLITQVEAELRSAGAPPLPVMQVPTMPLAPPTPAPTPLPMAPAPLQAAVDQATNGTPPMPAATPPMPAGLSTSPPPGYTPPEPPAASPSPEGLTFPDFMQHLSVLFNRVDGAGSPFINADYLAGVTAEISKAFMDAGHITAPLAAINDIVSNPAMVQYAAQLMQRDGKW